VSVSILAFVIIRLSRTMRSLKHLLELVGELRERGVGLASSCSTSTPPRRPGRLAFHIPGRSTSFSAS
jgi:DNA invertase Pin-like site-specific DNA recombinase